MLKIITGTFKWTSLVILILPSILFLAGRLTLDQTKWIMLAATIGWFAAAGASSWQSEEDSRRM